MHILFFMRKFLIHKYLKKRILLCYLLFFFVQYSYANGCENALADKEVKETFSINHKKLNPLKKEVYSIEAELTNQGYRSTFYQGLDKAYQLVDITNQLRKRHIDPKKTHIPELATLVPKHIAFIEDGIHTHEGGWLKERLRLFEKLKKSAQSKLKHNMVTYKWWITWNHLLAIVVSDLGYMEAITGKKLAMSNLAFTKLMKLHDYVDTFYSMKGRFPSLQTFDPEGEILWPIIFPIGVMAMNVLFAHEIYPLGLSNTPRVDYDNPFHDDVLSFFEHDIGHSYYAETNKHIINNGKAYSRDAYNTIYLDNHIRLKPSLPQSEREMLELIFFLLTHETYSIEQAKSGVPTEDEMYMLIRVRAGSELYRIFPEFQNTSYEEIYSYVREAESVFNRLFLPALEQHNRGM